MKTTLAKNHETFVLKQKIAGSRVGHISGVNDDGQVLVDFPGNPSEPIPARLAKSIKQNLQQRRLSNDDKVLLVFENDDLELPIIIDEICDSLDDKTGSDAIALQMDRDEDVYVDGRRVTFEAKEQIELRCGKASITLTRAGKVLIRGAYLLSRSSGVNRIRGGSVQLN